MGSFYSNIHLRTADRATLERAWDQYWAQHGAMSWAMVSPPYAGWISVFDWQCDQMQTETLRALSAFLSERASCAALAFQVQDSELAEYWLADRGKEVDHFTSNMAYVPTFAPHTPTLDEDGVFDGFGPDITEARPGEADLTDGGNTGLLLALTGARVPDIELDAILRSPAAIADDILTALASALGINDTWAAVGYHYLVTEGDTIPGIGEFHHLPVGAPPNRHGVPDD
ncbi:MAG TPA: hypothetical protein PK794_13650 [Armatimonadota bacterium]|nr:hypothetical protein [Armatimonadota bacterium]